LLREWHAKYAPGANRTQGNLQNDSSNSDLATIDSQVILVL
jgi:hypothetical protein